MNDLLWETIDRTVKHVLLVVGARPNVPKIAPIETALHFLGVPTILLFTGQHEEEFLNLIARDDGLRKPDINLRIAGGNRHHQRKQIIQAFTERVGPHKNIFSCVVVVGDVTSTAACARAAYGLAMPIIHVEAGLRLNDGSPEERNRREVDRLSTWRFTTSRDGVDILIKERVARWTIHCVGNVMIDAVRKWQESKHYANSIEQAQEFLCSVGIRRGEEFVLATFHHQQNVEKQKDLEKIVQILMRASRMRPVVLIKHPTLMRMLEKHQLLNSLARIGGQQLKLIEPVTHHRCLALQELARCVLTDSSGLQEETTYLNIPCLTVRVGTERPYTMTFGSNWVVGTDPDDVIAALEITLEDPKTGLHDPPLWDGYAGERCARVIAQLYYTESYQKFLLRRNNVPLNRAALRR